MPEFRQQFLADSLARLAALSKDFGIADDSRWRRDAFRIVHTIKGGAQAFGLNKEAHLAAEIESLFNRNTETQTIKSKLEELAACLAAEPSEATHQTRSAAVRTAGPTVVVSSLARRHFEMLAASEKEAFALAARGEKPLYRIAVRLNPSKLGVFFRLLNEQCEVVASLPEDSGNPSLMAFSIIAASDSLPVIGDFEFQAEEISTAAPTPPELERMFARLSAHLEGISDASGKAINLSIFAANSLAGDWSWKLFPILLHLVRNAADHGIAVSGTIEIGLFDDKDSLLLSVADDGRGIDTAAVKRHAVNLALISADDHPDDAEILQFIFAHGFSTANEVTDISGRGVGLDVVKSSVDALNGKISVRNRKTKGTVFTAEFPKEIL